jgi:fumarate hydratase class I
MDKFTDFMLSDTIGVAGMIGKSERGPATIKALKAKGAVYFMAVGGAAYLISKAIKSSKLIAFEDLGPEAIYEFEVEDMPVTVAVDSHGVSVHETGPAKWRSKIGLIPVKLA